MKTSYHTEHNLCAERLNVILSKSLLVPTLAKGMEWNARIYESVELSIQKNVSASFQ